MKRAYSTNYAQGTRQSYDKLLRAHFNSEDDKLKGLWFSTTLKRVYDGQVSVMAVHIFVLILRGILRKPASLFAVKSSYA